MIANENGPNSRAIALRLRSVATEGAGIVSTGVVIALLIVGVLQYLHRPTLEDFKQEYAAAPGVAAQQIVAERYLNIFTPKELMGEINGENVDGVCHVQSHGIGRAVFKKTQNFSEAIKQCGDSCTFGCFHGAMMEMFSTDSDTLGGTLEGDTPADYLAQVKRVAADLCWRPEIDGVVSGRSCTHGIGHSFQSLTGDLKQSVASCAVLKDPNSVNSCRAGAFMEYLFNPSSRADLLDKGAGPCDQYPDDTAACYQYKAYGWILAWGSTDLALFSCNSFGTHTLECVQAVARAGASQDTLKTPGAIDTLCSNMTGAKHTACMTGAYFKVIDLNNINDFDHVCDEADATHHAACLSALASYKEMHTYRHVI